MKDRRTRRFIAAILAAATIISACTATSERSISFDSLPDGTYTFGISENKWYIQKSSRSNELILIRDLPQDVESFFQDGFRVAEEDPSWTYQLYSTQGGTILHGSKAFGVPKINSVDRTGYFMNGKLVKSGEVRGAYRKREQKDVLAGSELFLLDGTRLFIYNPDTGELKKEIDLAEIFGENDTYSVDSYIEGSHLLVGSQNRDVYLLAQGGNLQQVTEPYKEFFDAKCQQSIEARPSIMAGVPTGDGLKLLTQLAGELRFELVNPGPSCAPSYAKGSEWTLKLDQSTS
ncbi:hypothetical protein [Paenibacillus turpanensis]|uniref:hypothetical protein n=1 Tax=Paenibacillus turpanensis TaxID=2689078 RepID=UPI00140C9788|nr:hypothetical protein [Paenibacillus turpanensis]